MSNRGRVFIKKIFKTCAGLSLRLGHTRGKTTLSCFLTPSRRFASLHYPELAKELFAKAEETAKAKYERLKKLVEFYNV